MQPTTALRKISAMRKRIRVIRGGQGAGKTYSILQLIANTCSSNAGKEWYIISEELTKMRDSVIKDFVKILISFGVYQASCFNQTNLVYTFPNGSTVKFKSTDKEDSGKGVRSSGVYFNEVNKVTFQAYNQYASRAELVICDYNPDAPFFVDDEVIPREDCEFLQLTYVDNEMLGVAERNEIEGYKRRGYDSLTGEVVNKYWANMWQVYGLGNIGSLLGAVYENWTIVDEVPKEARLAGGAVDFGYTNDPTAIPAIYNYNNGIVIDEIAYSTGMSNADIARCVTSSVLALSTLYCDSAEPKSIDELKRLGVRAKPCVKGADSIDYGVQKLQGIHMYVTRRSINAIHELRNYVWATDRNGKSTNKPKDANNHLLDAVRYFKTSEDKYNGNYKISR